MRFKVDENLPLIVAELLREAGFDTHTVHEENLAGSQDADIDAACRRESRIIVTLDLDFADIRAYPPAESAGAIVLRPKTHDIPSFTRLIRKTIALLKLQTASHQLWIVTERRVRTRS